MSRVAVVKGERSLETVYRALDLIPFEEALGNWERVLIKVNFITTRNWETGATTDPIVVEALVNKLRAIGKDVIIVESDATTTDANKAWVASDMNEMGERLNVPFINMRYAEDQIELDVPGGRALKKIKVAKIVTESAIISAAKLKTHTSTKVTLGMKNMFGMLTTKLKGQYHIRGIDKVIHDINKALPPQVTVIDGFVGMEGAGPVHGKPVKMDTIIAGVDVVSTDAIACNVMGFKPEKVDHIRWGHESGIGTMSDVEVVGDSVESVRRIFQRR